MVYGRLWGDVGLRVRASGIARMVIAYCWSSVWGEICRLFEGRYTGRIVRGFRLLVNDIQHYRVRYLMYNLPTTDSQSQPDVVHLASGCQARRVSWLPRCA